MAVVKAQKQVKKPYKELVLKAVADSSTGRRGGIHYNTLRARVRNNAEKNGQVLGPNSNGWTRKSVKKLDEDDGILDATDLTNITVTPKGKKQIRAARRAVGFPDAQHDDVVWKRVASSRKRAHTTSIDDSMDSPSRPSNAKRPRRSSGTTPLSRKTKAQLLEEIHDLMKNNDDLKSNNTQSPSSMDRDEYQQLLDDRDAEIAALKAQLDLASHSTMEVDDAPQEPDGNMFTTPSPTPPLPSNIEREPHTPTPPPTRPHHLLGLTRVQSGSFINHISKQPTPDPSTPEPIPELWSSGWGGEDAPELDEASPDHNMLEPQESGPSGHMPMTPDPTPRRPLPDATSSLYESLERAQQELRDKEVEVQRLQSIQDESAHASQELAEANSRVDSLQELVDELERALVERDMLISTQETDLADLAASKAAIEQSLASLSSQFAQARGDLASHENRISSLSARALELSGQVKELEKVLTNTKEEGSERVSQEVAARTAIQRELEQLKLNAAALQARYDGATSQANDLRTRLKNAEDLAADRLQQLSVTAEAKSHLEEEFLHAISAGEVSSSQAAALENEISQLQSRLQSQLDDSQATITSLRTELRQSSLELQHARDAHAKEVAAFRGAIAARDALIESGNQSTQTLTKELESLRADYARISSELDSAKTRIIRLQNMGNEERVRSATLQCELDKSRELLEEANDEILDYKASKAQDDATISSLKAGFTKLREIQMQSLSQLEGEIESAHASPIKRSRRSMPAKF